MKRAIPNDLYGKVLTLTNDIAQSDAGASGAIDDARASEAYAALRALFTDRQRSGDGDPFLTETLADFTDDTPEAIRLYELALQQAEAFPEEATVSKRIGLARALVRAGRATDARAHVDTARREAFAEGDPSAIRELDELAASCGTGQRRESGRS